MESNILHTHTHAHKNANERGTTMSYSAPYKYNAITNTHTHTCNILHKLPKYILYTCILCWWTEEIYKYSIELSIRKLKKKTNLRSNSVCISNGLLLVEFEEILSVCGHCSR